LLKQVFTCFDWSRSRVYVLLPTANQVLFAFGSAVVVYRDGGLSPAQEIKDFTRGKAILALSLNNKEYIDIFRVFFQNILEIDPLKFGCLG
jgi:hypothetical protein